MTNNHYYRARAIASAIELNTRYPLKRCIQTTHRFCEAVDSGDQRRDLFQELYAESDYDPCLDEIMHLSMAEHGCRQLLSALYFVAGDRFTSDLWQQKHILGANRIFNRHTELNDGEEV